jgi:hypothetical protein
MLIPTAGHDRPGRRAAAIYSIIEPLVPNVSTDEARFAPLIDILTFCPLYRPYSFHMPRHELLEMLLRVEREPLVSTQVVIRMSAALSGPMLNIRCKGSIDRRCTEHSYD